MPSTIDILTGLTRIANEALPLAVIWHVIVASALVALVVGWRPSRRIASMLLTLPLLSAAGLALAFGNPFNTLLLGSASVALLAIGWRLGDEPVARRHGWATVAGVAVIAFGWVYPHFLVGHSPLAYAYAAPTGLVPCPTLSLAIGFALLGGGLDSRAWSSVLAITGAFYGAFGALRLGVSLDWVLLAAAVALFALAFSRARGSRPMLKPT